MCFPDIEAMPQHENPDESVNGFAWAEPVGGITCSPEHQLDITIFNQWEPSVSMTYNLDTW